MKRLLCLILTLSIVFAFASCGNKNTPPTDNSAEFIKPENYASVVLVSINPLFRLYLDIAGEVLAVEPVNDDAKSIADCITTTVGNIEKVIENIIVATNEGGFVKEDATVNIEISEIKDSAVNTEAILNKAKSSADSNFKELKITIEVKISVSENAIKTEVNDKDTNDATSADDNLPENTDTSKNTSSDTSSNQANSTPENSTTSANTQSQPTHTHSYSSATCLNPPVCSCGAVGGTALGHSYKEGTCSRCGAKDPNFSYTPATQKNGRWKTKYLYNDILHIGTIDMYGPDYSASMAYGDPFSTLEEEFQQFLRENFEDNDCEIYNGVEYYFGSGDGDEFASVTETGNVITITDLSGNKLILERTGENSITVKSSSEQFPILPRVPVGTTFTFVPN
ncbi:MAG: hypothetical protein J6Q67_02635 [Clostridia bacterium]|nr:hypothetical protein [Clostridia bacterium]